MKKNLLILTILFLSVSGYRLDGAAANRSFGQQTMPDLSLGRSSFNYSNRVKQSKQTSDAVKKEAKEKFPFNSEKRLHYVREGLNILGKDDIKLQHRLRFFSNNPPPKSENLTGIPDKFVEDFKKMEAANRESPKARTITEDEKLEKERREKDVFNVLKGLDAEATKKGFDPDTALYAKDIKKNQRYLSKEKEKEKERLRQIREFGYNKPPKSEEPTSTEKSYVQGFKNKMEAEERKRERAKEAKSKKIWFERFSLMHRPTPGGLDLAASVGQVFAPQQSAAAEQRRSIHGLTPVNFPFRRGSAFLSMSVLPN